MHDQEKILTERWYNTMEVIMLGLNEEIIQQNNVSLLPLMMRVERYLPALMRMNE